MEPVRTAHELYAHAIAMEREAAERYGEFAQRMADLGNDGIAAVFAKLGAMEAEHLRTLENRTQGVSIPDVQPDQYRWLDAGPPETAARELIYRLMTPRWALAIALDAEMRAKAFFDHVYRTARDPALRALAQELAMEEKEHVAMVALQLERTPEADGDAQRSRL